MNKVYKLLYIQFLVTNNYGCNEIRRVFKEYINIIHNLVSALLVCYKLLPYRLHCYSETIATRSWWTVLNYENNNDNDNNSDKE